MKKTSGDIDVHAPIVISNAGIANTFGKLLPKEVTPNIGETLGKKYKNLEFKCYSTQLCSFNMHESEFIKFNSNWVFLMQLFILYSCILLVLVSVTVKLLV